ELRHKLQPTEVAPMEPDRMCEAHTNDSYTVRPNGRFGAPHNARPMVAPRDRSGSMFRQHAVQWRQGRRHVEKVGLAINAARAELAPEIAIRVAKTRCVLDLE